MTPTETAVGCQTFTWEMLGADWRGDADDLVRAISGGGYDGIEITDTMIGRYAADPGAFARALEGAGLRLVAFAFGSPGGFSEPDGAAGDLEAARRWIDFAARFPGATVSLGSATAVSGGDRDAKLRVAADIYDRAGAIGRSAGVDVAIHPSSHHNTMLLTRRDYDDLFRLLDPAIGWVPDTGHMLRGGHHQLDTLRAHLARIRYLHLKDVDAGGRWAMLGQGVCDTAAVIETVRTAPRFNGWIVVEEESDGARADPAAAVRANRETLRAIGF